jgi:hypothetical protein
LRHEEKEAGHHIDKAIDEIKKAAIDDGKDLNDHPPVDVHMDWPGRLHRTMELLDKAHEDSRVKKTTASRRGCNNVHLLTLMKQSTKSARPFVSWNRATKVIL